MKTVLAMVSPPVATGTVGPVIMVFLLLFLIVGLVVSVRTVLKRVRDSALANRRSVGGGAGARRTNGAPAVIAQGEVLETGEAPLTARELKALHLRGGISKAEYEERLRALQLDDYLKGES